VSEVGYAQTEGLPNIAYANGWIELLAVGAFMCGAWFAIR
jgi:hypothetical protein